MEEKLFIIPHLLKQRGKHHSDFGYCDMSYWYWCWFYTLKSIICVLLGRQKKNLYDDGITEMAIWDYQKTYSYEFGAGAEWFGLAVGVGIFSNWHIGVYRDGYP